MSSIDEALKQVWGDLLDGNLSDERFFTVFETSADDVRAFGARVLRQALARRDPQRVELGTYVTSRYGFDTDTLDALMELAEAPWHRDHDSIISLLGRLRSPRSVDVLYRTALAEFAYLDYDDTYSLGKKCIWALEGVPSEHALERLDQLASSENEVLATTAIQQLTFVHARSPRSELRQLAGTMLATRDRIAQVFANALDRHDEPLLRFGLEASQRLGLDDRSLAPLLELAHADFHQQHAEVRAALRSIGSEAARKALHELDEDKA